MERAALILSRDSCDRYKTYVYMQQVNMSDGMLTFVVWQPEPLGSEAAADPRVA